MSCVLKILKNKKYNTGYDATVYNNIKGTSTKK